MFEPKLKFQLQNNIIIHKNPASKIVGFLHPNRYFSKVVIFKEKFSDLVVTLFELTTKTESKRSIKKIPTTFIAGTLNNLF